MKRSLVDDFLRSGRRRFAAGTVVAYSWALWDWEAFIGTGDPSTWTVRDIDAWQDQLAERLKPDGSHLSPRTRQLAATAMRSMLKWAARQDYDIGENLWLAVDTVKAPRRLPRPLPPEHLDRLLAHYTPRRPAAPLSYYRDRALFCFLVTTGARVSEALQMTVDDVASSGAIVQQKGGSSKVLFAPQVAQEWIADYLRVRTDNHPALWVRRGSAEHPIGKLSAAGVLDIWHRAADHLGIPRFTTHQLRHTCATELMDAGVPQEVIAAHLGHHGTASLAGYAEVRLGRRQEALDAMQERFTVPRRPPNVAGVIIKAGNRRTSLVGEFDRGDFDPDQSARPGRQPRRGGRARRLPDSRAAGGEAG